MQLNTETDSNPRGSFIFTGVNTEQLDNSGKPVAGTGYDFADFLLGLPQQTSVQFGSRTITSTAITGICTRRTNGKCAAISPSISACARNMFLRSPKKIIASRISIFLRAC